MIEKFRHITYNQLLHFYLLHNLTGFLGEFNKKHFPSDYKDMERALEEIKRILDDEKIYK